MSVQDSDDDCKYVKQNEDLKWSISLVMDLLGFQWNCDISGLFFFFFPKLLMELYQNLKLKIAESVSELKKPKN